MSSTNGDGNGNGNSQGGGFIDEQKFSQYFLLALFIAVIVLFVHLVRYFILPIMLAAVFATLFHPLYLWLLRRLKYRGLSALACCLLMFLILLVPVVVVSELVVHQAVHIYQQTGLHLRELVHPGNPLPGNLENSTFFRWLDANQIDWQSPVRDALKMLGTTVANIVNRTSKATVVVVADIFIIFFTMFYFFRDGEDIVARVKNVIPLGREYKDEIVERFRTVSRATIKGTLIIALLQGTLGALTLWAFGIRAWVIWGLIITLLALVPFLGNGVVLIPTGIIRILTGHVWEGIVIILISAVFISSIDNVLRPRLVGRDVGMHDLLVFFSTLGGIALFGVPGFIVGPVIAAFFITILDIFTIEFQSHLRYAHNIVPSREKKPEEQNESEAEDNH